MGQVSMFRVAKAPMEESRMARSNRYGTIFAALKKLPGEDAVWVNWKMLKIKEPKNFCAGIKTFARVKLEWNLATYIDGDEIAIWKRTD